MLDDYVFIAMEGGLTRNEESLVEDGKEDLVREYRLAFQETVKDTMMGSVAEITGRRVLTYHSQIVFHPPRAFEIFLLEPRAHGCSSDLDRAVLLLLEDLVGVRRLVERQLVGGEVVDAERVVVGRAAAGCRRPSA